MKNLIIVLVSIYSFNSFSYTRNFTVMDRKFKKKKAILRIVTLKNLTNSEAFEGDKFKILLGRSEEAIKFTDDKELVLKAATTYYHLSKAQEYWAEVMKSPIAIKQKQLIIRLEITDQYSSLGHFAHKSLANQYNNALTIAGGETPDIIPEKKIWGDEIWFRPMKKIKTDVFLDAMGENPLTSALNEVENPVYSFIQQDFQAKTLQALFFDRYQGPYWQTLAWSVGSFAVMKLLVESSKLMDKFFIDKWYYLDTALLPEVSYHEYSHYALKDHLGLSHSTGVVEGLADFFTVEIASTTNVYSKIKNVSTASSKNAQNKKKYQILHEAQSNAQADFVLGVLWQISEKMPSQGLDIIYQSRKYLNKFGDGNINDSLVRSLLDACDDICKHPFNDKNIMMKAFRKKGF